MLEIIRIGIVATDRGGRFGDLHQRIFRDPSDGKRRNCDQSVGESTGKAQLQSLAGAYEFRAGDKCEASLAENKNVARPYYGIQRTERSDCYEKGEDPKFLEKSVLVLLCDQGTSYGRTLCL